MAEPAEHYAFNPDDPSERQGLELKLQADTELQHSAHTTLEAERHYADVAEQDGHAQHTNVDTRINQLEDDERWVAGEVVTDEQNIDHWDHAHPGWDQHADGQATGDGSAMDPYADDDGSVHTAASDASPGDPYAGAYASTADPYAGEDPDSAGEPQEG